MIFLVRQDYKKSPYINVNDWQHGNNVKRQEREERSTKYGQPSH
jgi:hypothetical protein